MSLSKLWAIASKELYTTLRDRNLILIMFATPLVLSTIIGLAFGGFSGDTPTFSAIDVVVVNQDEGFQFDSLMAGITTAVPAAESSSVSTPTVPDGLPAGGAINLGSIVASILLSEAISPTTGLAGDGLALGEEGVACPLLDGEADDGTATSFQGSLEELLNATAVDDVAAARQGVEVGDYAVAVLIPPGFTATLMPTFGDGTAGAPATTEQPQIEVYGNSGDALAANIVNSIVTGIVHQFERLPVTLEATAATLFANLDLSSINLAEAETILLQLQTAAATGNWTAVDTSVFAGTGTLTDTFAILGCLFAPEINPITLVQEPLDSLQAGNVFARVLVVAGSAQAVFFALFTGVFGILSLYDERKQWTLQRMLASPTTGNTILLGKLLGNLVVVVVQLLVLMLALTAVASLILGEATLIWGTQFGLLLLLVLSLGVAVSGLGTLVVGLARTPEQVQIVGPVVNIALGIFGGAFGFSLPEPLPRLSLITWGTTAFEKLAGGQGDVRLNLLVLLTQGLLFFVVGAWFFRRRLQL